MPQHKGFEPFTFIWALQVRIRYKGTLSTNYDCADTKCVFFADQADYDSYKNFINTGQFASDPRHIELVTDLGKIKWWNDRAWIVTQLMGIYINGFFDRNLLP